MKSGIYCIENLIDNKKYIGKAAKIISRKSYHFSRLKINKHFNKHLQNSWNKFGENNFSFYILEECSMEDLSEKEKYWISKLGTSDINFGYNLTDGGDGAATGIKNPRFGKGLPEHLYDKGFKTGIKNHNFGKKSINSKSKYLGISYVFQNNKISWRARIRVNKVIKEIGYFETEKEAALAYNKYIIDNNLLNPLNILD